MSKKLKHSKIKNTGVLFEVLTRQVTADIMENVESKAVPLIKKHFHKNSTLGKELELYNILTTETYKRREKADRLVDAVIKSRQRLSNKTLRSEKFNLIKDIKETYDVNALFSTRMPNYRRLASIYKLFLYETTGEDINPKEIVESRDYIVESLITEITKQKPKSELAQEYIDESKDVKLLAYTLMVEKFNKKYSTLSHSQKEVLRKYINNVSNTNSLSEFIEGEVINIKNTLKKLVPGVTEDITSIKLKGVIIQADALLENSKGTENKVITLMRYYELVKELEDVSKKSKKLHS